jgi:hypothetical protein
MREFLRRGRLPRRPVVTDSNSDTQIRNCGRAWQPSPTKKIGNPPSRRNPKQPRLPVRADTAVRPYAEIIVAIKVKSTKPAPNAMRGGMLSARAGRRKWCHHRQSCQCVPATSARTRGTHRASALLKRQTIRVRITDTAGGHGGPPLHRGFAVELAFQISSDVLLAPSTYTDTSKHNSLHVHRRDIMTYTIHLQRSHPHGHIRPSPFQRYRVRR